MNATYFDVATILNDEGSFGSLGIDIFGGSWSVNVDKQVLVLDGVGTPSDLKEVYEQVSVQILVRGAKLEADHAVYLVAKSISDHLLSLSDCVIVNGTAYKGFEEESNIAPIGKDDNERSVYSMNFFSWRNRT